MRCLDMENLNYKEIGKRIQTKRKEIKITQEKLSEIIDVSPSYISEIERGSSICSLATLTNIANTLGASLDYLVLGITKNNADNMFTDILESPKVFSNCQTSPCSHYLH